MNLITSSRLGSTPTCVATKGEKPLHNKVVRLVICRITKEDLPNQGSESGVQLRPVVLVDLN